MIKPAARKTQEQISAEWDRLARVRSEQIERGKDLSFSWILVPTIFHLSSGSDFKMVVDVGCGPGFLTKELASKADWVVGVDSSHESVSISQERFGSLDNVEFVRSTIEDYSKAVDPGGFTLAVANMFLMTCLNLENALSGIARLLRPGGNFVFTIAHPAFWPIYWDYADEEWFDYNKEIPIEGTFRISLETCEGLRSTHVHRPLEQYFSALGTSNFVVRKVLEPMPGKDVEAKYPKPWKYPRFLGVRCERR
ncbi:MAG: class I SAM-dependent methyltransferase [Nitrososphaera sp.]|nr:class I SAM-dependent methyltransferase [Nitrososphaera sp.]